jgi:hypothetical protein
MWGPGGQAPNTDGVNSDKQPSLKSPKAWILRYKLVKQKRELEWTEENYLWSCEQFWVEKGQPEGSHVTAETVNQKMNL